MPLRKSLRWKAASASRRSAAAGLVDLAGVGLDLGFELDRRVGEIIALERLVGGDGGNGQQQDERSCKGSANEREHGGPPVPAGRGNPNGGHCKDERAKHVEVVTELPPRDGRADQTGSPDDSRLNI